MKRMPCVMALGLAVVVLADGLHACSTFCVNLAGRKFFGRNYDFEIGDGMVMVNPAGLRKKGFQPGGPGWTSKFGSVTFNQFGRDNPMGGMNEASLVVELMWLEETRYPGEDARRPLGNLEWIQYQLDTAGTVEEVLESHEKVRIEGGAPLHYLVSDASGRAAAVEFLDGRLVAHTGDTLPVPVLTNSTYEASLGYLRSRPGRVPGGSGSPERFARAATRLDTLKRSGTQQPVQALFEVLADVAQRSTRWSIVYDQTKRIIHFRTDVHRPLRYVAMDALSFSCTDGARLLDIDTRLEGDVSNTLKPYSTAGNLAFITRTYAASSVTRRTPGSQVAAIAAHPESATCAAR
ncbi:MAG TPA: linear amide C-N hydrolase [Vicinamibacterales bacterium]|nr:linear amide C-N hydrolase [Vicinamibacterales bacterium]